MEKQTREIIETTLGVIGFLSIGAVSGITLGIARKCEQADTDICYTAKPQSRQIDEACLDNNFSTIEDIRKKCGGEIAKVVLCDDKSCGVILTWECEKRF